MKYYNTQAIEHTTFTDDNGQMWFVEQAKGPHKVSVVKVIDGKRSRVLDEMSGDFVSKFHKGLREINKTKSVAMPLEVRETTRKAKAAQMKRLEEEAKYDQSIEDAYNAYNEAFDSNNLQTFVMATEEKPENVIEFTYANRDEIIFDEAPTEVESNDMTDDDVDNYVTMIFQQHHAP